MPQMSPMFWIFFLLYFIILLMLLIASLFFSNSPLIYKNLNFKNKKMWNWKW